MQRSVSKAQAISSATPAVHSVALPIVGWRVESCGGVAVLVSGDWNVAKGVPDAGPLLGVLAGQAKGGTVCVDARDLTRWDSTLPVFMLRLMAACRAHHLQLDLAGLPDAARALLLQAGDGAAAMEGVAGERPISLRARVGHWAMLAAAELQAQLDFTGRVAMAFAGLLRGARRFRFGEFLYLVCRCGPGAVPIVTLVSLLTGMILAFVGAVQLRMFGAQLYIADLVGLGMAREMGAMMTAVLVAGRTGAAYAAELGSMRVNDEIDALHTLGINPVEFLVLPRLLALTLVTPLLCIYADCMGILGGALVTAGMFGISMPEYFNESRVWVDMTDFNVGIAKSAVFAVLVAVAGCMRGMRCGSNSSEVGYAATSAVVTGIVWVVVADAILTLIIATLDI